MVNKTKILFTTILLLLIPILINAAPCDSATNSVCEGQTITTPGYGAVQLCEECFICGGLSDGVCPEDFASEEPETNQQRLRLLLKTDTNLRPDTEDLFTTIYETGADACPTLGGTCSFIEELTSSGWTTSSVNCNADISNRPNAHRAVCENVQRTAGCYNCPDPDCRATVRGIAFNSETGEILEGARLRLRPVNPNSPVQPINIQIDNDGRYEELGIRGNFNLECVKENYDVHNVDVFVSRGENIFDCPLREASCNDGLCSINNIEGVPICRAFCEGQENCAFEQSLTSPFSGQFLNLSQICDGRRADSVVTLGRINETHVETVTCCNQNPVATLRPSFDLTGEVSDLITRDFVRILDDEQVTVKIIVYR